MASRRGETQSFCSPSTFSPPPRLLSTDRPAFLCFQTETAATRIAALLAKRREQEPATAVRVGIKARGCNGLSYTMDDADKSDDVPPEWLKGRVDLMRAIGTWLVGEPGRLHAS